MSSPVDEERARLLGELRQILKALDDLPPRQGTHGPRQEAEIFTDVLAMRLFTDIKFLWKQQRDFRQSPRHSALISTVEHLEARLLVQRALVQLLGGLLAAARTDPYRARPEEDKE